jgi:hypothetical protein
MNILVEVESGEKHKIELLLLIFSSESITVLYKSQLSSDVNSEFLNN